MCATLRSFETTSRKINIDEKFILHIKIKSTKNKIYLDKLIEILCC